MKSVPTEVGFCSGNFFDIMNIEPDKIDYKDIAINQARMPRYAGATYGVNSWTLINHLQICDKIACAKQLKIQDSLRWLGVVDDFDIFRRALFLHDAPEYITADIISPVKSALRALGGGVALGAIEKACEIAIGLRFDIDYDYSCRIKSLIKEIDIESYLAEAAIMRPTFDKTDTGVDRGVAIIDAFDLHDFISPTAELSRMSIAEGMWRELFHSNDLDLRVRSLPRVIIRNEREIMDDHPDDWVVTVSDNYFGVLLPNHARDKKVRIKDNQTQKEPSDEQSLEAINAP